LTPNVKENTSRTFLGPDF